MREWKSDPNVQKVHDELYTQIDPNDASSDTYATLIIKHVFTSEKERTHTNVVWVQSVLEAIFDKNHLSTKIDNEVVNLWSETLTDTDMVSVCAVIHITLVF